MQHFSNPLRVLVVDDTVLYRKILSDVISNIPGLKVIGTAANGKIALSPMTTPQITPEEIKPVADYIFQICGIVLDASKDYLIESRLGPLAIELECNSYQALVFKAKSNTAIEHRVIDAISTNETSFFRDHSPFELFQHKIIPDHIDHLNGASKTLSIWSAASSTGQEIYTIAILLKELLPDFNTWNIRLLGTDISEAAITQASAGRYNQVEIQRGLPPDKRDRYFDIQGNIWQIKDELRATASFRKLNLCDQFTNLGKFDIIFCRNVAIYFGSDTRKDLFGRLANQLNPHGTLIIGSTESLLCITDRFDRQEYHNSVYYTLKST